MGRRVSLSQHGRGRYAPPLPVDLSSLASAMRRAAEARRALSVQPGLSCYRLAHADADGLPGITADRFGDVGVLSLYRELSEQDEAAVLDAAVAAWSPRAVYLKRRPREARVVANTSRAEVSPALPSRGEPVDRCVVEENGLRFDIRPGAGLSVGLFLDMREARAWVRAHAAGRTVLNTFSYTCGFSVAARAGGAVRALNVDASRRVLDWGEDNHRLNGLPVDRRDFVAGDVFEWLKRLGKKGEAFDLVILDPPSFATTRHSRFSAARDYPGLVAQAAAVLAPGGTLLACCNLSGLTPARHAAAVKEGLARAGRTALASERLSPGPDFPAHPDSPHGLQVLAVGTDSGGRERLG
jgi:23S rRNA (cytosine1962-C5)-methyltransferase